MRDRHRFVVAAPALICVLSLVLAGCAGGSTARGAKTPTAPAPPAGGGSPSPSGGGTAPAGWYPVLPGMRFTDISYTVGLAVSAAQPGRLVGCALPAEASGTAAVLATSADGGRSWQTRAIQGAPSMAACALIADAQDPATFMLAPQVQVGPGSPGFSTVYGTTDGGQSWQVITPPDGYNINSLGAGTTTLVAGHLLVMLAPVAAGAGFTLGERSPDGSWRVFPAPPGLSISAWPPRAWAMDPANPAHLYLATWDASGSNTLVLASRDSGATWQRLAVWPHGENGARLWTAMGNRVYGQPISDTGRDEPVSFSADGGATWRSASIPETNGYPPPVVAVHPAGGMVVVATNDVLALDEAAGRFVRVGPGPGEVQNGPGTFPDGFICALSLGSAPALVCGGVHAVGGSDNYGFPLPAHL